MTRTVIIGPTGSHLRTVNVATGPSGATGVWETVHYAASAPAGLFETVKVATERSSKFKSVVISGFTGTVTPDAGGGGENVLQLDGENLQLGGENLTLGE